MCDEIIDHQTSTLQPLEFANSQVILPTLNLAYDYLYMQGWNKTLLVKKAFNISTAITR